MTNAGINLGTSYAWLDDVTTNSDTDIHYAVELCLTHVQTLSTYTARQWLRQHLIKRYENK